MAGEGYDLAAMQEAMQRIGVPMNGGNMSRYMAAQPSPQVRAMPVAPGTPAVAPVAPAAPQRAQPQPAAAQPLPGPPPIPPHMLQPGPPAPIAYPGELPPNYQDMLIPDAGASPAAAPSTVGFFDSIYNAMASVPAPVYGALGLVAGAAGLNAMRRGGAPAARGGAAPNMPQAAASAPGAPPAGPVREMGPQNAYARAEAAQNEPRRAFGRRPVVRTEQSIDSLDGPLPYAVNPQAQVDNFILNGGIPRQSENLSVPGMSLPGGMPQFAGNHQAQLGAATIIDPRTMRNIPGNAAGGMPQYNIGQPVDNVRMGGVAPPPGQPNVQPFATPDNWQPLPDVGFAPPVVRAQDPGASIRGAGAAAPSMPASLAGADAMPPIVSPSASPQGVEGLLDSIMRASPQPPAPARAPAAPRAARGNNDRGALSPAEAARRKAAQKDR